MVQIVRRVYRWTDEYEVLDQVCQPAFSRPLLLDEAAFVPHEQAYARFVSLPGEDRIAHTVPEAPADHRLPIKF